MMKLVLTLGLAAALSFPAVAATPSVERTLQVGGRERSYHLYRPVGLAKDAPVPLVVMLHGGLGSGEQAEEAYGWDREAERGGFVVVYPDGVGRTWNAGGECCGPAKRKAVDDVGFLDTLLDTVARDEHIDRRRIYLAGMSNGGAMTYRYACEGKVALAAIGPVATSFTYACPKVSPLPVMAIHGLDDKTVPFGGGAGRRVRNLIWQPVQASLDLFRDAASCGAPSLRQEGEVTTSTAQCEKGREVVLITVSGSGHQWPGSKREEGLGARLLHLDAPSEAFDATARLWGFFRRYASE